MPRWPVDFRAAVLTPILALAMATALAAASPALAGKRVALVVGNDAYQALTPLQKAVNDARAVKGALTELGFTVITGENLTRREMNVRLSDLDRAIAPGDQVFVFYAGHGVAIGAENYLLPVDMPLPQGGDEALVKNEGHAADAIIRSIQGKGAATTFVVLDACRNNPISDRGTRNVGLDRGLARMDAPAGVFVLFSAGIGQTALDRLSEGESEPNSVFTRKLVPLLRKPGLSHVDLAKELQQEVSQLAATIKHRQEPAYYDQIIGRIVLKEGPPPAPVPAPAASNPSEAERAWGAVKESTSTVALEAYVKQFPGTVYAALAEEKLAESKRAAAAEEGRKKQAAEAEAKRRAEEAAAAAKSEDERKRLEAEAAARKKAEEDARNANEAREAEERRVAAAAEAKRKSEEAAAEARRAEEQRVAMLAEEERKRSEAAPAAPSSGADRSLKPGTVFRDCADCPEMVVVPAGSFTIGSPASEEGRDDDEGPTRMVTIAKPFAVGKFEVTRDEFEAFVKATGHMVGDTCYQRTGSEWKEKAGSFREPGYDQTGSHPAVCVSWEDAKAYAAWLSQRTGKAYRLLTEAEWEYAARAGTTTPFSTGKTITADQANFDGNGTYGGSAKGKYLEKTITVGSFKPNAFGLHDMHGNVWEWVEDCYKDSYRGAPADGSASTSGDCSLRVLRGGSWSSYPRSLRAAVRGRNQPGDRYRFIGFRLARTLD